MFFFYGVFFFLVMQRFVELGVARRNRAWMEERGGIEIGQKHYPLIVTLHTAFFLSLWIETAWRGYLISEYWPILFIILFLTQILRYWALFSLGPYWNTRIIILPGTPPVVKGPYRYFRHPNYLAVIVEIAFVPFLFHAYITSLLFTLLNALMLKYRIHMEEAALSEFTDYREKTASLGRFLPHFREKD